MRTLTMVVLAACLASALALAADEETPRADRGRPPAVEPPPDLSQSTVNWQEVAEALKSGGGATAIFYSVLILCAMGWGLLAFVLAVSPNLSERVGKSMHASRLKCLVIGVGAFLFLGSLVAVSQQKLAIVVLPVLVVGSAWGLCGVCEDLGRRAWMLTTRDTGRLARVSLGWPILYFVGLIPIVGWFLFAVLSFCGLGAFFIALFSGAARTAPRTIP